MSARINSVSDLVFNAIIKIMDTIDRIMDADYTVFPVNCGKSSMKYGEMSYDRGKSSMKCWKSSFDCGKSSLNHGKYVNM
jgi:hypothetical protein